MDKQEVFLRAMRDAGAIAGLSDEELVMAAGYAVELNDAHAAVILGVEVGVRECGRDEHRSVLNALTAVLRP